MCEHRAEIGTSKRNAVLSSFGETSTLFHPPRGVARRKIGLSPALRASAGALLCSTLLVKQHANSKNENHHSCSYEQCFYHAFLPLNRPAQQMIISAKGLPLS
jgi:hypothetical protein